MTLPAIVWIIMGGTAVAVAASSSSRGGSVATIKRTFGKSKSPAIKFMDSRYDCTRGQPGWRPYVQGERPSDLIPYMSGYEYLADVPANATARVAAMRLKVRSFGNMDRVKPFVEASDLNLFRIASDIYNASRTPADRLALANKLGLPVSQINNAVDSIAKVVGKYAGDTAAIYVRELINYGADYVSKLIRDYATKIVAEKLGDTIGVAAAEAIPVVGQILQAYTKFAAVAYDIKDNEYRSMCEGWVNEFEKAMSKLTSYGFPLPWNMLNVLSPKCREYEGVKGVYGAADRWTPTTDQNILLNVTQSWFKQFMHLSTAERSSVSRWWTLASTLMSDERVGSVFAAMCSDSLGGTIASDEQVMVVAAPIAVMYGLDVDALATKLYDASNGWVNMPSGARMTTQITKPVYDCGGGIGASGCDIVGHETICGNVVTNCFVLNLATLTSSAFPLAEKMKRDGVGLASKTKPGGGGFVKPVLVAPIAPIDSAPLPTGGGLFG